MARLWSLWPTLVVILAAPCLADYLLQGDPRAGGMRDVMLIYNDPGLHRVEHLLPYVAYLDKAQGGKPVDWFYDSFLFMAYGGAPSGKLYIDGPTNLPDWRFWLDALFEQDRNLSALDATIEQVSQTLGPPPQKTAIIVMIPYPSREQTDFGDPGGAGRSLNFSQDADRVQAIRWFVGEMARRFEEAHYRHLSLWGCYWMNEGISAPDVEVVKQTGKLLHEQKLGFHWIPWFDAPGSAQWQELGFDFAVMQPNYAFMSGRKDRQRLTDCANLAKQYGLGIEIELDAAVLTSEAYRENLRDYLSQGVVEQDGYMAAVHGYYQGESTIRQLYQSDIPANNQLYRDLYLFAKRKYQARSRDLTARLPVTIRDRAMPKLTDGLTITDPSRLDRGVELTETTDIAVPLARQCGVGQARLHLACAPDQRTALQRIEVRDGDHVLATTSQGPSSTAGGLRLGWVYLPLHAEASQFTVRLVLAPGGRVCVDELALDLTHGPTWGCGYKLEPAPTVQPPNLTGLELTDGLISLSPAQEGRGVGWDTGRATVELRFPGQVFVGGVTLYAAAKAPFPPLKFDGGLMSAGRVVLDMASRFEAPDRQRLRWGASFNACLSEALKLTLQWSPGQPLVLDEIAVQPAANLALGKPYALDPPFPAKYPDDGRKLTDGALSAGFGDGKTVGWMGWISARPTVTLDLGEPQPVDAVRVQLQGGGHGYVHFPGAWEVSVSPDGAQWTLVHSAEGPPPPEKEASRMEWWEAKPAPAPARFVRLAFQPHGWLMLSEIEVLSGGRNVAAGRPYLLQPQPSSDTKYADNEARLTDGVRSDASWGEGKTVGWDRGTPVITVDLLQPRPVQTLAVHLAGGGPAAVWFPSEASFQTSLDGATWSEPVRTSDHPPETGDKSVVGYMLVTVPPRPARFVRVALKPHGWVMPDEIEVYSPPAGE